MSGWDAGQWINTILTGMYVLLGLALLLWRPKPGQPWWRWDRLFGAAIIILALVLFPIDPNPTRGGLIGNGVIIIAVALWFLLGDLWSVNGPDLPSRTLLRQRFKPAACLLFVGGTNLALGLSTPR